MTTRILSALHSILEGVTLARTVLRLAREHDSLSTVTAELQSALDAALDREQAARTYARRWKESARSLRLARDTVAGMLREARAEIRDLTTDATKLADITLDSAGAGELCAETLAALQVEHERMRGDLERVSRSWGECVRVRTEVEAKLRAEEAKTAVLRAQVATLELEPKSGRVAKGGA